MKLKKSRFGPRLVVAAREGRHYRDVHVFVGGTGAVGGAAALQMLAMFDEMIATHEPGSPRDVPILIITGRNDDDLKAFEERLKRYVRSRFDGTDPREFERGYLTPSGVYVALTTFQLKPIPHLDLISDTAHAQAASVDAFLKRLGTELAAPHDAIQAALLASISHATSITDFLKERAQFITDYGDRPFTSLLIGIPLPSVLAYHTNALKAVIKAAGLSANFHDTLKAQYEAAYADDLQRAHEEWKIPVLIAHTTGVGGMYDELENGRTVPRLGFAHAGRDEFLRAKHEEAERLTRDYVSRGSMVLVTAAAIGVDEVRVRERIPLHNDIVRLLRLTSRPIFFESQHKRRPYLRLVEAVDVPLRRPADADEKKRSLFFRVGDEIKPEYAIRSGENGFFSPANADSLFRVMKVASASELGHVLAGVALLGDDPNVPWFTDGVCHYNETANARQVFEFLYQPGLVESHISGLDPMALQDLGSAKHQAELHLLGLLILMHRLQTADFDLLGLYPTATLDARQFLIDASRPLTFRDLEGWHLSELANRLRELVVAEKPEDLLSLKPLRDRGQFEARDAAHLRLLERVLRTVHGVTSLGSPIVYENHRGVPKVRTGYWAAPLGRLVEDDHGIASAFSEGYKACDQRVSLEEYEAFEIAVNGFVDVRPVGILCTAKSVTELREGSVVITRDPNLFAAHLARLEPYSFFATAGLIAVMHRLRALGRLLREVRTDLGTMQDWLWQMPRDRHGHVLLVPGVAEALRMISEGLEKTTGTEWIDGLWGYDRRRPANRMQAVLAEVFGWHGERIES